MRIARVHIANFANFANMSVETGNSIVVVGENKVGKTNLLLALRLLLDPGLSERDRQLGLEHFWDGLGEEKLGATIEVSVDLTNFDDDERLLAHLADCLVALGPPMTARLTYRFQPKPDLEGPPASLADYEYVMFGGDDPDRAIGAALRRMLPLDVLAALRDAEMDLASWRRSPLRPLIEDLGQRLDPAARDAIVAQLDAAQGDLSEQPEVGQIAAQMTRRLREIAGPQHGNDLSLGLAPTQIDALLRGLRLLIDAGARGVSDASLGTANLIFLALKSLELDRLAEQGERDHTFLGVEEPEAHLHPHVQRLVYRHFLGDRPGAENELVRSQRLTSILTTHSPHIASVAPLRSIVLLRRDPVTGASLGVSTVTARLTDGDVLDLQRYIDVTRGELYFARGIVLVEGDAERFLVPAFASKLKIELDELGVTVCSVAGTNFAPYIKLVGPDGLAIPHVVLTDCDPVQDHPPRARNRIQRLLEILEPYEGYDDLTPDAIFDRAVEHNIFVNNETLETDLFSAGLGEPMRDVLAAELLPGQVILRTLDGWVDDPSTLDGARLISLIERVGKGRFAQLLAPSVTEDTCPRYMRAALRLSEVPLRSVSATYLRAADDFRDNPGQRAAYESHGNCVVLAGPGSGKTKTLTVKLARVLAEDVRAPRGVACITYSQECARELSRRLEMLGVRDAPNLFVGTIHGFCLRHLLMPYSELAGLNLPYPLTVATTRQTREAFAAAGEQVLGHGQLPYKRDDVGRHRRVHLDREGPGWRADPDLAELVMAYENELRLRGLIDFDDLVVLGYTLVDRHDWILSAVKARFPILAIDEYQDLGVPLHRIVMRLAFDGGVRLFAVGDADQSVYGFAGADGNLLNDLARRADVERIQLRLNYRSAGRIIRASEMALGEERGYEPRDAERQATIRFVGCPEGLDEQARRVVEEIVPAALGAKPGRKFGDIAVLYRAAKTGDSVAERLRTAGIDYVRIDSSAPYRKCALTSWIEDCAAWCAGGWREGRPLLGGLIDRWVGFRHGRLSEVSKRHEGQQLSGFLWARRTDDGDAGAFVAAIRDELLRPLFAAEPSLADQREQVDSMVAALALDGPFAELSLAKLGGRDGSPTQINLLTLHSAKDCEYDVLIMLGLDLGMIPWRNERPETLQESRRLFYVGFTRARDEVHMLYSGWVTTPYGRRDWGRSPFVEELEARLLEADAV